MMSLKEAKNKNLFDIFSFSNEYEIRKRNTVTREEEVFVTHNIVTNTMFDRFVSNGWSGNSNKAESCKLGSGSGVPSESDTDLFHFLFYNPQSPTYSTKRSDDGKSIVFTYSYVFPASSSYVGTITELGLGGSSLTTHALVKDSEGNPISIEKTALDELIVTAKITISSSVSYENGQVWNFNHGFISQANSFSTGSFTYDNSYSNPGNIYLSKIWSFIAPIGSSRLGVAPTSSSMSKSGRQISFVNEWDSEANFKGFVNSICIGHEFGGFEEGPPFRILFPNTSIFPSKTIKGVVVGTGDGVKSDFSSPIPYWISETEILYKNNSALTRGVDYFVDEVANLDKDASLSLGNFLCDILQGVDIVVSYNTIFGLPCKASSSDNFYGYAKIKGGLTASIPQILKYDTTAAFTSKVNMIKTGSWYVSGTAFPRGTSLVFSHSIDGEKFEEFYRITNSSSSSVTSFVDSGYHSVDLISSMNYLKIEVVLPDGYNSSDYTGIVYMNSNVESFLGYVGDYSIRFVSPPSDGDVITMDLMIDRPFKSSEFVIQFNPVFNF